MPYLRRNNKDIKVKEKNVLSQVHRGGGTAVTAPHVVETFLCILKKQNGILTFFLTF